MENELEITGIEPKISKKKDKPEVKKILVRASQDEHAKSEGESKGSELDKEYVQQIAERFDAGANRLASESEIGKLEKLAERNGVAPLVTTQSETRAAFIMNATCE
jgi:hypothetical protein